MGAILRRGEYQSRLPFYRNYKVVATVVGVPCVGGVQRTQNLRLPTDELAYIIGHAQDSKGCKSKKMDAVGFVSVRLETSRFDSLSASVPQLVPHRWHRRVLALPCFRFPAAARNVPQRFQPHQCATSG